MKPFQVVTLILALAVVIGGCSPQDVASTPTPTVVVLDSAPRAAAAAEATPVPPTPTAIPAPEPTATFEVPTPIPTRAVEIPTPSVLPPAATAVLPTAAPAPAAPQVALQAEIVFIGLNVRSGPGVEFDVIGELAQGDKVEVLGVNPDGTWYQIRLPTGEEVAWISANTTYTRLLGDAAGLPVIGQPSSTGAAGTAAGGSAGLGPGAMGKLILQLSSGGDIYLANADGSGLRRLTTGIDPALSPDGTKIAFTRWDNNDFGEVWIYDLATGAEQPVLGATRQAKAPAWSPDGRSLVVNFQHEGHRESRRICHTYDSFDQIPAPPLGAIDISFEFVDDGIEFCYWLPPDPHWALRKVEIASGDFQDLASDTYSFSPAWDPINPWRVFFDGSNGIMQLDVNRDEWWPLTTDLRDHNPTPSPDGSRLAVSYKQHDHWEVYTIDLTTGVRARLTRPPLLANPQYNSVAPAWSPDGRQIAFVTDRTGKWEYWVMNADGSNQRPLFPASVAAQLNVNYNSVDERMISWGR